MSQFQFQIIFREFNISDPVLIFSWLKFPVTLLAKNPNTKYSVTHPFFFKKIKCFFRAVLNEQTWMENV